MRSLAIGWVVALALGASCTSKSHDAPAPTPTPAVASGSGSGSGSTAVRLQPAIDVAAIKNLQITAAVAQGIPARSIAFVDATGVVIARLDVAGLHGVSRAAHADQLMWTGDGKTLVALTGGTRAARAIMVAVYADGGAATAVDVPTTVGPDNGSPLPEAELGLAATGEVWLRRCRDKDQIVVDPDHRVGCKDRAYRRLAPASPPDSETTTPPAGFTTVVDEAPDSKLEAPAGYTIRPMSITDELLDPKGKPMRPKRTNDAWSCDGPNGRSRWPSDDELAHDSTYTKKGVTWIRADPPLYRLTGTWTGPMGDKTPSSELLLACDPKPLDGFVDGGGGLWARYAEDPPPEVFDETYRPTGTWTLQLGATPIATIAGSPAFAIAPAQVK